MCLQVHDVTTPKTNTDIFTAMITQVLCFMTFTFRSGNIGDVKEVACFRRSAVRGVFIDVTAVLLTT
jgi:hypothetical protein